ncbi:MAG: toll/interleukin-1 receptor domain-containing protein [Bryobacteraceae bacterium]
MPYLPGFQSDVFISYSHIDDQPFGEEQKRWVSEFHKNLEIRIKILLGRGVDVWRDPKLRGVDVFSSEIERKLSDSAVLVSILSPAYVQSEWCSKELETFVQAVEQRRPTSGGDRFRIVKVLKTPVPLQRQATLLRSVLGYEFYGIDPNTARIREFFLDPSPEARSSYWRTLDDVAQDIANLFSYLTTDRKPDASRAR